jgi:localization factor PodJL
MLPGISVTVAEAPNAGPAGTPAMRATLPMPGAELGPLDLREAAANSDACAEYAVALRYTQGHGSAVALAPNWTEAARWFALAASAGLAPAQYRLAVLYERGDGVAKDFRPGEVLVRQRGGARQRQGNAQSRRCRDPGKRQC